MLNVRNVEETTWTKLRGERTLLEDSHVVALNKPAGIAVVGNGQETDLMSMARAEGEHLLPAHRIDKETSGAILFAKDAQAHASLARQFNSHTITKAYLAITTSRGLPERGTIALPLSLGRKKRVRVAAQRQEIVFDETTNVWSIARSSTFTNARVYPATTGFVQVWEGEQCTLLLVRPVTGRTHQIRVHLAWIGYPILGDPLFRKGTTDPATRMFLHSWRIGFQAEWADGARVSVEAAPGDDFWSAGLRAFFDVPPATLLDQAGTLAAQLNDNRT